MLISEPKTEHKAELPRYAIPLRLLNRATERGLTVGEAKALAADIRIWLIGMGHDDREEEA